MCMLKFPGLLIGENLISVVWECLRIIVGLLSIEFHDIVIPPQTPLQ